MPGLRLFVLIVVLWSGAARAGELADFNAAVEAASAHNRAALGALRSGNAALASPELDQLRTSGRALTERFAGKPPDAFAGNPLYDPLFTVASARLVAADMMLNSGRPEAAAQSLADMRGDLYVLRKASGVVVLTDCVRDANTALNALIAYDDTAPDWSKPATRPDIVSTSSIYDLELDRCDAIAGEPVHSSPEFRRAIDGAKAGLALVPKAVATRHTDLLHKILIELRSFDTMLAFRFG